jgi:hypothetical protein
MLVDRHFFRDLPIVKITTEKSYSDVRILVTFHGFNIVTTGRVFIYAYDSKEKEYQNTRTI